MAANSGDLVRTLIEGGLAPQAARAIANALANAASPTFSQGKDIADATPTEQLRLITADTRRYQLTNLDFSPSAPFQDRLSSKPGEYAGPTPDHPYKDSQPVTSAPPLSAPRVQANDYIAVDNEVDGNAAVSRVGLRLRQDTGRHLRIDPSTKFLDALPFLANTQSAQFLSAEFVEQEEGTELVVSLRNLESMSVLLADGTKRTVYAFPDAAAQAVAAESLLALAPAITKEGTWTPRLYSYGTNTVPSNPGTDPTVTYDSTNTYGKYLRVGQWVYVAGRIDLATLTAAGNGFIGIKNLPFDVEASPSIFPGAIGYKLGFAVRGPDWVYAQDLSGFASGLADSLVMGYHTDTGTVVSQQGMMAATIDFAFSCMYRTSDP